MDRPIAILPDYFRPIEVSMVRMGSEFDGGYVLCKAAIDQSDHLLSFGLYTDWTFEFDYLDQKIQQANFGGIDAYDPTLTGWLLTKRSAKYFWRRLRLKKVNSMGTWLSYRRLFRSRMARHHQHWIGSHASSGQSQNHSKNDSNGKPTSDFQNCMSLVSDDAQVYLKIDIENSEYEILSQIAGLHDRVAGISIEYHEFEGLA